MPLCSTVVEWCLPDKVPRRAAGGAAVGCVSTWMMRFVGFSVPEGFVDEADADAAAAIDDDDDDDDEDDDDDDDDDEDAVVVDDDDDDDVEEPVPKSESAWVSGGRSSTSLKSIVPPRQMFSPMPKSSESENSSLPIATTAGDAAR